MKIVKLHGTSGSGKTTVARGLMAIAAKVTQHPNAHKSWPEAYTLEMNGLSQPLHILGPYVNTCGGLDVMPNVLDHIRLLQKFAPIGHVFYESLLGSEYYGRMGAVTAPFGDDHIFAFLDTPVEVCIQRIKQRRADAGNLKTFSEFNTRARVKKIERLKYKLEHELSRKVVTINHTDAVTQVHNLFKE